MTPTSAPGSAIEHVQTANRIWNSGEREPEQTKNGSIFSRSEENRLNVASYPAETSSDYGDFADDAEELEIIETLLSQAATWHSPEDVSLLVTDIEDHEAPRGVRFPKRLGIEQLSRQRDLQASTTGPGQVLPGFTTENSGIRQEENGTRTSDREGERSISAAVQGESASPDSRSPLERFRRPPKKVLSVTDLVSPAWCELQYSYTLSKHGRKKKTPAMSKGSRVHQDLEDEVHVTVPVRILKKEDSWGLRIWNIIQGLRMLRDTGRTREIEIWGTVGGEIVNGIIDELSYECPDPKLEEDGNNKGRPVEENALPEYQTSITDYLLANGGRKQEGQSLSSAMMNDNKPSTDKAGSKEKRIYITDVKTRAHPSLPTGASIRPTILQLHLYHHMLENLAQGNFPLAKLTDRYNLDPSESFSDSFIAQIGSLNQEVFDTASSQGVSTDHGVANEAASSQDSMDILLQHNNLSLLWDLMMSQFRRTFLLPFVNNEVPTPTPQSTSDLDPPAALPTRLSPILTAEYLSPTYKHVAGTAKKAIGSKSFMFNAAFLKSYLEDNLSWWRGEREAKGVELQEAWKCRSCDFRDDCSWIHERDAAAVAEVSERKKMRQMAGADGTATSKSKV